MSWGRGGMVGVRKAIWKHEQTIEKAKRILETEHGTRHQPGEHSLCPFCDLWNHQKQKANARVVDDKTNGR